MPFRTGLDHSPGRARQCILSFLQYDSPVRWVMLVRPCLSGVPRLLGNSVLQCSHMLMLNVWTFRTSFSEALSRMNSNLFPKSTSIARRGSAANKYSKHPPFSQQLSFVSELASHTPRNIKQVYWCLRKIYRRRYLL